VVTVRGVATGVLGDRVAATAEVTMDTFAATEPGRVKTFIGGIPELPATVVGLGAHGGRATLPVTWDPAPPGAFDRAGVATLTGVARVLDGTALPATARVQVTEPGQANAALADGASVTATFTESGYSPAGLRNGVTAEKAWSNWRSGTQNPSETITVTLAGRPTSARPDRAVVTATAGDPYATVHIARERGAKRTTWLVTVTSEDGSRTRAYRVEIARR